MSAIAGYCLYGGDSPDPESLGAMGQAMSHRGPGPASLRCEGAAGVVYRPHVTTSTTALEIEHDGGGRYWIAADARIDNRSEVGARLGLPPTVVDALSDQGLILRAFLRWGRDGFASLTGDFAVVIWDTVDRTAVCARDPFGVRPLYVYRTPSVFAFASEPKALFASGRVPKRLDEVRLAEHLAMIRADPHRTIYEGVSLLGSAEVLTVSPGGDETRSYYDLEPDADLSGRSHDDLLEGFRSRFWDAVTACTRSTVTVGAYLSGGLDSSSVACVAREVLRSRSSPLHTFSAVYDGVPASNERPYIEAVIEQGGLVPHVVHGDAISPLDTLDAIYALSDDDPVGGNHHIVWAMLEQARSQGVQVLLDGHDGDNVVGHGTERLYGLARDGEWGQFQKEAVAMSERFRVEGQLQPFQRQLTSPGRVFAQSGYPALQDFALGHDWGRLFRGVLGARRHMGVSRSQLARTLVRPVLGIRPGAPAVNDVTSVALEVLSPEFVDRTGLRRLAEAAGPGPVGAHDPGSVWSSRLQVLRSAVFTRGISQVNLTTGTFGIESRHPFLNRPLVEYCLGLPGDLLLRDGWTRYVLRAALKDVLPGAVSGRAGKSDHTAAYVHTFSTFEGDRLNRWAADPGPFAQYVRAAPLDRVNRLALSASPSESGPERTFVANLFATYKMLEHNGLL